MTRSGMMTGVSVLGILFVAAGPAAGQGWLEAGAELAQASGPAGTAAGAESKPYLHWSQRVGPAYPDDPARSFGRWAKELPATLWDDTRATFTDRTALVMFGAAAVAGVALHNSHADGAVADHYERHGRQLNTFWDSVGDAGGNPGAHFAVAGVIYFTALARGDTANYERSKTLLNALALNGLTTLALKGIVHNDAPNGDRFAWPSGHTSSSFCFATVMYDQYGPWVGVPCFVFASYVGYERVDAGNHNFSDVISGALLGIGIAQAVCRNHDERLKLLGMDVVPWADPAQNSLGLALSKSW